MVSALQLSKPPNRKTARMLAFALRYRQAEPS